MSGDDTKLNGIASVQGNIQLKSLAAAYCSCSFRALHQLVQLPRPAAHLVVNMLLLLLLLCHRLASRGGLALAVALILALAQLGSQAHGDGLAAVLEQVSVVGRDADLTILCQHLPVKGLVCKASNGPRRAGRQAVSTEGKQLVPMVHNSAAVTSCNIATLKRLLCM